MNTIPPLLDAQQKQLKLSYEEYAEDLLRLVSGGDFVCANVNVLLSEHGLAIFVRGIADTTFHLIPFTLARFTKDGVFDDRLGNEVLETIVHARIDAWRKILAVERPPFINLDDLLLSIYCQEPDETREPFFKHSVSGWLRLEPARQFVMFPKSRQPQRDESLAPAQAPHQAHLGVQAAESASNAGATVLLEDGSYTLPEILDCIGKWYAQPMGSNAGRDLFAKLIAEGNLRVRLRVREKGVPAVVVGKDERGVYFNISVYHESDLVRLKVLISLPTPLRVEMVNLHWGKGELGESFFWALAWLRNCKDLGELKLS